MSRKSDVCLSYFVLGAAGGGTWNTLTKLTDVGEVEKEAWNLLFENNTIPTLYAGKGNPLGYAETGKLMLSSYLQKSSENISSYLINAFNLETKICTNNYGTEFNYDEDVSSLFLGGPVSNDIVKNILGYRDVMVTKNGSTIILPSPIMERKEIRWGQLHGETDFGEYNGALETAKRYDKGKLVERAVYKLIDKNDGSIISPDINSKGFLENEWLTIVRRKEGKSTKVIIGGMHGYSTKAFCSDITKNLEQINVHRQNLEEYQIIVPVNLSHKKSLLGTPYTDGELDWMQAKIQEIHV